MVSARGQFWWVFVMGVLVLSACGDGDEDGGGGGGGGGGLANPASVFCIEQGGTVEIVTDSGGNESGICHLPDGTEVEEWEYYRQSQGGGGDAGLANPAAVFCEERGGVVSGDEPMCELSDGTVVNAWEYFRAESDAGD